MNIPLLIAIILFVLMSGYFVIFPLSKKRPILIKNIGLPLYALVIFAIVGLLSHIIFFAIGVILALFFYITRMWMVFGISKEKIADTLQKATVLTRAVFTQDGERYLIDNGSMRVKIIRLSRKNSFVAFKEFSYSKRARLSKEVFRKFIQNHFLE